MTTDSNSDDAIEALALKLERINTLQQLEDWR